MIQLSAEESLLFLASRPRLTMAEQASVRTLATRVSDWPLVIWRAENYRIVPLLQHWLGTSGGLKPVPAHIQAYLAAWVALSKARSQAQFFQLGRVIREFASSSIEHCLLKGSGITVLYYPKPELRPMQDLDILVRPQDLKRVQSLLFDLGFRHGIWDSDSETFTPTRVTLSNHPPKHQIEVPPFSYLMRMESPVDEKVVLPEWRRQHIKCAIRGSRLVMPVFLDIHINVSDSVDIADVWQSARSALAFGVPIRILSATAMTWFVASRLYHEAFLYNTLKLSMWGDLHALLTGGAGDIDWAQLLAYAYKYGTRPSLYYVLAQLKAITGANVPAEVLAVLKPQQSEVPLENDWGDVVPKLLSRSALHEVLAPE